MTIDEMIERLQTLRAILGGEARVLVRDDYMETHDVRSLRDGTDADVIGNPRVAVIRATQQQERP
jgi:hypothetical protein